MRPRGIYGAVQSDFFFFFTSESRTVEEVRIKPGRSFKRYFKQMENALLFLQIFYFSWPFNGIENAMNYKEGFSWCCSSWSFHEATEFMAHEKPMVISLMLKV